jgi:hypothetical protein
VPIAYQSLQACALRVTRLDDGGAPVAGPDSIYTTDAFISVENGLVIKEGDSFQLVNACGGVCASYEDCDRIQGTEGTVTLCQLDAELIAMMTGATVLGGDEVVTITAAGTVTTFTVEYDGQTTAALTRATLTGAALQTALEGLSNIEPGDVVVTGGAAGPWVATFGGTLGDVDVEDLVFVTASGTGLVTADQTTLGGPRGLALPEFDAGCIDGFALEVWTKAWNGNQPAVSGGDRLYFRHVWPRILGVLNNYTLQNGVLEVPIGLKGSANSTLTAIGGPDGAWPTAIGAAPYAFFLEANLPTAVAGPTAYPIP